MKWSEYCRDQIGEIGGMAIVLFFLLEFLSFVGNTTATVCMIGVTGGTVIVVAKFVQCYRRNQYFRELQRRMEELNEPWLIAELLPVSSRLEDMLYQEILRKVGSKALEHIHRIEDAQREYEEYIEEWIHEVKTPLTSIQLMVENGQCNHSNVKTDLKFELKKIEHDVEKALYYARCGEVYRDYLIKRVNLYPILVKAINRNRVIIMNSSMLVNVDCDEEITIDVDEKWIIFVLTQIFLNAVKYKKDVGAKIELCAKKEKGGTVVLEIRDNGIGMKQEDRKRIFEKGFTGTNGRKEEHSTGMGLYIVKKICDKMGIGIWVESEYRNYTSIFLRFQKNRR